MRLFIKFRSQVVSQTLAEAKALIYMPIYLSSYCKLNTQSLAVKFKHKSQEVSFDKEQTVFLILLKQNLPSPERCPGSTGHSLAELGAGYRTGRSSLPHLAATLRGEGGGFTGVDNGGQR